MSEFEFKWNADAFDGIRIALPSFELEIEGVSDSEVELTGEFETRRDKHWQPAIQGRWLIIQSWNRGELTLRLPQSKAWALDIAGARSEITAKNVKARLRVALAGGDVRLENCQGAFNIACARGEIEMEDCVESPVPQAPPRPESAEAHGAPRPPGEPWFPPIPPIPPLPEFDVSEIPGEKRRRRISVTFPGDWEVFGREWEEWGERFAEKAEAWAESFASGFAGRMPGPEDRDGVNLRAAKGELELENIQAQTCSLQLGNGDVEISGGRIGELNADLSHGQIEIEGTLPSGAWDIVVRHGDLSVELPSDTYARINASTRHGSIDSNAPLVKVGRPGPESRHGGRMVGTVGEGQGEPVELNLETLHGDIEIEWSGRKSRFASRGEPPPAPRARAEAQESAPELSPTKMPVATVVTDEPHVALGEGKVPGETPPVQVYDSQLAVLQALSAGQITVAEAEMLLRSLKS